METLFSIIVPTYNRSEQMFTLIKNLQAQRNSEYELIIVDDSPVDESEKIASLQDKRIRYACRGKKLGVSTARNFGAELAKGRYLIFLDDDDKVTDDWLSDFSLLATQNEFPEMLFCGMDMTNVVTNKREAVYPGKELWRIIIPGSWAISSTFFQQLGGFDGRLLYGENTELFLRIRAAKPKLARIDKLNFFYYPSVTGGSKNIRNKIESTIITLEKHSEFFKSRKEIKRVLVQVVGVSYLTLNDFKNGRKYLWEAYLLNPWKLDVLLRFCIALVPPVSKSIYNHG